MILPKCFTDMIANETEDCDKFPSEFDRYDPQSLKNSLRSNRTKVFSTVHYKVSDNTRIMHLLTKQFLSSIVTYNKRICHCIWKLSTNKCRKSRQLDNYNQEKADTGIACHAIDVTKRDSFSQLVLLCSDSEVLLIMLHLFEMISSSTNFKTTDHKYFLRNTYESLTPDICETLLGFHDLKRRIS